MRARGLVHGQPQPLDGGLPVAADRDDRLGRADGEGGDQHSFDDEVWVPLGERPVAERRRVRAHQVGDDDLTLALRGTRRPPLLSRREARAASAAEAGRLHLPDNRLR